MPDEAAEEAAFSFDESEPLSIVVTPEPPPGQQGAGTPANAAQEDPGRSLDDYKYARLQAEIDRLTQQLQERKDLHSIRRWHAWLLFGLTVLWVIVIWLAVLLQGFGQWFFPWPPPIDNTFYLHFKLTDNVLIAFMTSTTATVLGLYGIAAYWLYGNGKKKAAKDKQNQKNAARPSTQASKARAKSRMQRETNAE